MIDLYPEGQTPINANVMQWIGVGQATQDEHVGLMRIDHRFTDRLSSYFRFSKNSADIFAPNSALPYGTRNVDAPTSGLFDFLYLASPATTNELRLGANYAQPLDSIPSGAEATITIPNLSKIPGGNRRIAIGISQSLVDNWTTLHGAHTLKAGVEIRRVHLIVHDFNLSDGTASFNSLSDFQNDNPVTEQRPLPSLDQIDVRGEDGVSSFQGLVGTLHVNNWHGWLFSANYMFSHALNDKSSGGGGSDGAPQNVACRCCDKGNSSYDATHVFNASFAYTIPFARHRWYGGWQWSSLMTAHTGLPLNVTVSRKATDVRDGNVLSSERPDLISGVPLYLDNGTTGLWLNPAAFTAPAKGTWGDLGRNVLRAPGLFQIDTAVSKQVRLTERLGLEIGAEAFNILNHPQLAPPASSISSTSNFGRITAPINTSPVGAGTPRQIQFLARFSF